MKKVISILLTVTLIIGLVAALAGCGKDNTGGKITVWGGMEGNAANPRILSIQEYYHNTWRGYNPDAEIEFISGEASMLMESGDYPDVFMKTEFQNQDIAAYAAEGILIPLEDYINEKDTPNIYRMFTEAPSTKAVSTSPDGHIYALPQYNGRVDSYIESFWYINKAWLDKLGLEIPKTLDELYDVLIAFRDKDPNGNGKKDEVPFLFGEKLAYQYPETLLSCWGVSTKFGMYDGWLNVIDGKVRFTPLIDEWKEMCRYYNKLYNEGLIPKDSFITTDSAEYFNKCQADTAIVGATFANTNPFVDNADQYQIIEPLRANPDITPVFHIHPGYLGTKNGAVITEACENPKAAMKFLDGFYDVDQSIMNWYGPIGTLEEGGTFKEKNADGMYIWNEPKEGETEIDLYTNNTLYGPHMIGYMPMDSVGKILESAPFFETLEEALAIYEKYIDPSTWPRPYYSLEDADKINTLLTDLVASVDTWKANFITGKKDVDKDWDTYIAEIKSLGAEEYQSINQRTYDVYTAQMESMMK